MSLSDVHWEDDEPQQMPRQPDTGYGNRGCKLKETLSDCLLDALSKSLLTEELNHSSRSSRTSLGSLSPYHNLSNGDEKRLFVDDGVNEPSGGYEGVAARSDGSWNSGDASDRARLE